MKKFIALIIVIANVISLKGEEGLWIPLLLKETKYNDMVAKGLKLSPDDLYSINSSSLKDAVGLFGEGCSFELVSDKGLILTNHHCGFGAIQELSSVQNDLLTNGFWAKIFSDELPARNLTVTFLIRMEDVSAEILKNVNDNMTEKERAEAISASIKKITDLAVKGTNYSAAVKPLYYGNQYFLYVTETFKDIRLVGAPPASIGKFGGDTDNWMWPRHTGDFSVFRIYAGENNKPADYSKDNVPFKPKKFLKISLKGVNKGDFTMVYGYPFYTYEYLPSKAVELLTESENPLKINIRRAKMDIMEEGMNRDRKVRIQYASKQAGLANGWKKWIGQNAGLKSNKAILKKKEFESRFLNWTHENETRKFKYGSIISEYENIYNKLKVINIKESFYKEAFWMSDLFSFADKFSNLIKINPVDKNIIIKETDKLKAESNIFFGNYNKEIERKIFDRMIRMCFDNDFIKQNDIPEIIQLLFNKNNGNINKITSDIFDSSVLTDKESLERIINSYSGKNIKILKNDPFLKFTADILNYKPVIAISKAGLNIKLDSLNRLYMKAQMEMESNKIFYPDANASLRLAYGKVDILFPRDAVLYDYFTTVDGIIEKDNPDIYDYDVPLKLKEIHKNKNYGKYGVNGSMPVCFLASNHTSGGNSGSPVLNSEGDLIGINFDRNWEGTMSDIMYDSRLCRNICLDIRYCLLIIDKFADAGNLIDEMSLVY